MTIPTIALNDGRRMPTIGLGTYGMRGEAGIAALLSGLDAGYRLLDTALTYGNEAEVGEAVRRSRLDRGEILITTKLPGRFHGFDRTLAGFEESIANLGLAYVDLYLIHWPLPRLDAYVGSWRAMIELRDQGRIRSIGVSNFTAAHVARIIDATGVAPAVNQIELHPFFPQVEQRAFDAGRGIITQSWSPLAEGRDLGANPVIDGVARAHGVTPAQAVLRWNVQLPTVPIPRSANADRQRENLGIFAFELSDEEMSALSSLGSGRLWGADPDTYESF